MSNIVVKYHSLKMLMTLDLNMLIQVLIETYGENIFVRFELMSSSEQGHTSKTVDGLVSVTERFWILEGGEADDLNRRKDLEEKIVKAGAK